MSLTFLYRLDGGEIDSVSVDPSAYDAADMEFFAILTDPSTPDGASLDPPKKWDGTNVRDATTAEITAFVQAEADHDALIDLRDAKRLIESDAITGKVLRAMLSVLAERKPTKAGLVLHYDMETLTPTGEMKDLAPPKSNGVITGTEIIPGGRRFNNPYNATTDFIDVPHDAYFDLSGDMAVFVRMTIRDSDPTQGFLEKSIAEATSKAYLLFADAGWFTFRVIDPTNRDVRSTTRITDTLNQQTILGGVKRGEDIEIWVNGTKEATTGSIRATNTGVGTLRIGGLFPPALQGLTGGDITEVLLYDGAPSAEEIGRITGGEVIMTLQLQADKIQAVLDVIDSGAAD